jgi:hypothetical protein
MQLNGTDRRRQLSGAVLALLGGAAPAAHASGADPGGAPVLDVGGLYYQESGGRISVGESVVNVRKALASDRNWNARLTIDAVSGGTPNGAIPSQSLQTFSTPSGSTLAAPASGGTQTVTTASGQVVTVGGANTTLYTIQPGEQPLDHNFKDTRFAASFGTELALGRTGKLGLGVAASVERDFDSTSANALVSWDLFGRNTTISAGVNGEADAVRPIGGAPKPWSAYELFQKTGSKTKRSGEYVVGLTQVVTRRWITQWNYGNQRENGYLTDPYKILSVVDNSGNLQGYLYESRPAERTRRSLYWENKFALWQDVLELSWRRTSDDWGIRTTTIEGRYRFSMGGAGYFEPHARSYRQNAANFYDFFLYFGPNTGGYASADPRLGAFRGQTVGLKYGLPAFRGGEMSLRVERYTQRPDGPASLPTALQGLTLAPQVQAWILQAGLRIDF